MLYLKVAGPAISKTLQIVGQRNVAEEILQTTFEKLWQTAPQFDDLRQAYAWVYKTCTRAAIDHLRVKSNQTEELAEDSETVSERLSAEEKMSLQQLWAGLAKVLSREEAEYFIYRNVEGLSQEEIVEVTNLSRRSLSRLQENIDIKLSKFRQQLADGGRK